MIVRGWVRAWIPVIVWGGVIWILSTQPFSAAHTSKVIEGILRWMDPAVTHRQIYLADYAARKSAHVVEYFVFCLLLFRGVRGSNRGWRWTWALAAFATAAGYAVLDEIHQAFVPSRGPSPYDSLLDSAGALAAMIVCWLWLRRKSKKASTGPPAMDTLS
jgi:VanZ family protein